MAQVRLENVTKSFDGKAVVSDLNLTVDDGQFMVIVGPSGSGKTTLLRLIAGLEKPTAGSIYIDGLPVNDVHPRKRDVAMVFQDYALYPHMTVGQNMAFGLKMQKLPAEQIQQRVSRTAAMLDIDNLLMRKPGTLSGGQQQRVALGRAIVRKPKVFLFDEPLSNLDPTLRIAMRTELKMLHKKLEATSIYVTHDQTEAMALGDRVCVIRNGNVLQLATPLELYEKPANRFVAGFFGTPPMNFLDGGIQFQDDNCYFVAGEDRIQLPSRTKKPLADRNGKEIVLGIRPHYVSVSPSGSADQGGIKGTVLTAEPLGDRTDVYVKTGSANTLVAATDPHLNVTVGNPVIININAERVHLFENGDTGPIIPLPANCPDG
ncbi:MAG: ABC transporter ATP-binding protein [Planctomycetes bacterium]|nr:ABC transporter ATP-binding protein [Planctomycetota bacterium]